MLLNLPHREEPDPGPPQRNEPTAILLVTGYNGFGIHMLLSVVASFAKSYTNMIFVSVGVIDSGSFKGIEEIDGLESSVREYLGKYVALAKSLGFRADYRMEMGTDVVETATGVCHQIFADYPNSSVFLGQLIFPLAKFYHWMLHNVTAFSIQRRLQWDGIKVVILPVRVALR
jgi:hypothetical protein